MHFWFLMPATMMLPLHLLISCLLVCQWRRWVAFWKALEELYRSRGVWMPNIDFYSIVSVIKGVRKWQTAAKWQPQPEFHSRGQYLTKLQYDNHSKALFKLYRLAPYSLPKDSQLRSPCGRTRKIWPPWETTTWWVDCNKIQKDTST